VVDEDLADVDELRRALPEHVDLEELARLPVRGGGASRVRLSATRA
jgi:hypothetical protein